MSRLALSTEIN